MNRLTLLALCCLVARVTVGCASEEKNRSEAIGHDTLMVRCPGFPDWNIDPAAVDSLRRYAREVPLSKGQYEATCQVDCSAWGRRVSTENVPMAAHVYLSTAEVKSLLWEEVYGIGRRILQELPEGAGRHTATTWLLLSSLSRGLHGE